MEAIKLDDFLEFKYFSQLQASGQQVAWVKSQANLANNNYDSNIWLKSETDIRQMTSFNQESSFTWYQDQLLFSAKRTATEQTANEQVTTNFYRLATDGGEAVKLFSLPLAVTRIEHWYDSKFLVLAKINLAYPDWHLLSDAEKQSAQSKLKEQENYLEIEDLSWWSNGVGFTNQMRLRLFLFDLATNQLVALSAPQFNVADFSGKADHRAVLYYGEDKASVYSLETKLFEYQLADQSTKCLLSDSGSLRYVRYFKDGLLVVRSSGQDYGLNENPQFYYYQAGKLSLISQFDYAIGSSVGSDVRYGGLNSIKLVDEVLYFVATINHEAHLLALKDQKIETILAFNGSIDGFDISNQQVYLIGLKHQALQELYAYDLNTQQLTQITTMNEAILADKYVAKPEALSINETAIKIDGWVLKPKDYDATKQYPAILNIHGGPKTVFGEVYYHEMQYWANQGYFVFFCNPRGSDGKGNEFADIRGKYGTIDYQDLMDFTEAVLKKYPSIDQKRLAVTGGSYGGFMTNWIITQTNRFQAAATQRSISNWISFAGTSDIGTYFTMDQQGVSSLYREYDKLWDHSPLKYIEQAKTPTLVIHSNEDYRCWIPEGMQLYTALKMLGVPTKLMYFKGENHELSRSGKPVNRIKRLAELTAWFDQYAKNAK